MTVSQQVQEMTMKMRLRWITEAHLVHYASPVCEPAHNAQARLPRSNKSPPNTPQVSTLRQTFQPEIHEVTEGSQNCSWSPQKVIPDCNLIFPNASRSPDYSLRLFKACLTKRKLTCSRPMKELEEEHLQRQKLEWEVHMFEEKCQQYEEHIANQQRRLQHSWAERDDLLAQLCESCSKHGHVTNSVGTQQTASHAIGRTPQGNSCLLGCIFN
eukprot:jgi/Botrbrau1/19891/Bobra.0059s0012.1